MSSVHIAYSAGLPYYSVHLL